MGLFDFLKKKQDSTAEQTKSITSVKGAAEQTLVQRDSFLRNGFKHYTFIANRNCCEACANLNGKHFPVSELKIGINAPPMHEGCRCSIAAYEDRAEYEAWLNKF